MKTIPLILAAAGCLAAQPALKPIPPAGIAVPDADRVELSAGLKRLHAATLRLAEHPLVPDVLIYQEAVRYALEYNEFFRADEIAKAKVLLRQGEERAVALERGQAPWTTATGLVVRGYLSKIDRSIQPYGLVVPASYSPTAPHRWRLDTWFHGRSENLSELNFLSDRQRAVGEFAPRDTIVLHLYGRFCNASKFAGEVDLFEALAAVKRQYPIDENRILIRGFSMGGASAWHIGTHFAGLWAAVSPGAGFAETALYQKMNLAGPNAPPAWEQKLFRLYDSAEYAANLFNTATIEYHGELDPQQQAGDVMEKNLAAEGLRLIRLIGPKTEHRFHPDTKLELARMLDDIAARGRDPYPRKVRFTTFTLAYNQMKWVTIDGLEKHWERARVDAEITSDTTVAVTTSNVTAVTLDMGAGGSPLDIASKSSITIDGQKLTAPGPKSDRSWTVHLRKAAGRWAVSETADIAGVHKKHGLQGPVDDAFLDSFLMVTPTGQAATPAVGNWVESEQKRAITEWRRQFRGEARVRADKDVTDDDIASSNLVLWGDPSSNRIIARIADKLPAQAKWTATQAPILIYPNPLNPNKYIVLNSGFTFREADWTSNSKQTPKLPDWAVVDITTPAGMRWPGKIVDAGFFNEDWK